MESRPRARCLEQLRRWLPFAEGRLRRGPDGVAAVYGPGGSGHWDIQAQATAATAFAVAATDPEFADPAKRRRLADTALAMTRYLLGSHQSAGVCLDGQGWGGSWISALALERLSPALILMADFFNDADRTRLETLLTDEARVIPEVFPVTAALDNDTGKNHPESNMWNGVFLHRVASMYPAKPEAEAWRKQADDYLANAICVPADAGCDDVVAGRAIRDWHKGANFFPSYACNHHGYLNVAYMYITLSNLALWHFSARTMGWPMPEMAERHARELWEVVKALTFDSGRLLRLGGDTRVRYAYGQDYALPVWRWAAERFDDAGARAFTDHWLGLVETEAADNTDGSFFGRRLAPLAASSPLYHLRLEGDRACCLATTAWRERILSESPRAPRTTPAARPADARLTEWSDEFHGAYMARGARRTASWCWEAAERPNGLCVPSDRDDLAEWRYTLAGQARGMGMGEDKRETVFKAGSLYPGGFVTCGSYLARMEDFWSEGGRPHETLRVDLAVAALPDDATVLVLQRARSPYGMELSEAKGLYLPIPNDALNGRVRAARGPGGSWRWDAPPPADETVEAGGPWLVVDERLAVAGLYGGEGISVYRPALARSHIFKPPPHATRARGFGGELRIEEICFGRCHEGPPLRPSAGEVIWDIACAVRAVGRDEGAFNAAAWTEGSRRATESLRESAAASGGDSRTAAVTGADGRVYALSVDWGGDAAAAPAGGEWKEVFSLRPQADSPAFSCGVWIGS